MLKKGRKYYRIGEVSQIVGVEPHVLRFWEKEFRQIQPRRISGRRLYRQQDLAAIKRIKELLYKEGYTIAGARKRLDQERSRAAVPEPVSPQPEPTPLEAAADSASPDGPAKGILEELRRELVEIRKILGGG